MAKKGIRQQWEEAVNPVVQEANNIVSWKPLPGPQTMAYTSEADELFYGGAAGGGKSFLILGLALSAHQNSIIFRREYPQLKGLLKDCKKILKGTDARYNSTEKTWSNLPGGRSLEFGACQHEDDVEKYQGRPHDLKAIDEITHFSKSQFKFLTGWLRTDDPNQKCRVVCTGNPPTTSEGRWVIEYWAPWLDPKHPNPAKPGELRWFAVLDGEDVEVESGEAFEYTDKEGKTELVKPRSRTFIPAKIEDNPIYMKTGYKSVLQSLPEPLRSQMLKGDFAAGVEDDPWQAIPTEWVQLAMNRWKQHRHIFMTRPTPMTCLGVDVARGGSAKTVIAPRYGSFIDKLQKHAGKTTPNGGAIASLVQVELQGDAYIHIDICGVGSSPYDTCVERGLNAHAANGAGGSMARDKSGKFGFINKRAEWYWHLREILDPTSGDDIALPDDPELLADLTAPKWKITSASKIQIESKEDIQKRIGRSPDCGDSVVYAFGNVEFAIWAEDIATWG
ncbi:Terminase [Nostoc sp. DSM 114161]|uniref:terminase large subunit domain-containing protein n=1 Tax=Nostoc sp. DSM 114161 TaxID=3440143 RepID=UPI0040456DC5